MTPVAISIHSTCCLTGRRLRRQGQYPAAAAHLREAVAQAERTGDDIRLVQALNELGLWCKAVGRYDEAIVYYERALTILESSGNADSDNVATLLHNLAGIDHARGAYATGEALARRGLAIRLAGPRPGADGVATDLIALAGILDGLGRWDESEALYVTGLSLLGQLRPEPTLEVAVALSGLGTQYLMRGRPAEAARLLERAAVLKQRVLGPAHPDLALTLNNLAVACSRTGTRRRAAALRSRALGILRRSLGQDHPWTKACRK